MKRTIELDTYIDNWLDADDIIEDMLIEIEYIQSYICHHKDLKELSQHMDRLEASCYKIKKQTL